MTQIKVKRGIESRRSTVVPADGEPLWSKDTKELWIGDGTIYGGHPVGTVKTPADSVTTDNIAVFADDSGRALKEITKATLLTGMATEQYVKDQIIADVPDIKVKAATRADEASNADTFDNLGVDSFVKTSAVSSSYSEDSTDKVLSTRGSKQLYDDVIGHADTGLGNKLDTSKISQDENATDADKVPSMGVIAKLKALISSLNTKATNALAASTANAQTITTVQGTASSALQKATASETHLTNLPGAILSGSSTPITSQGDDGDLFIQY